MSNIPIHVIIGIKSVIGAFFLLLVLTMSLSGSNMQYTDAKRISTSAHPSLEMTVQSQLVKNDGRVTIHSAATDPSSCASYDPSSRLITVTCKSSNLTQISNILKNPSVLREVEPRVWLLNSNLTVADGANLTVNSDDTKWLRINSSTSDNAYHIDVLGNLKIDSVRISSWNSTSNNYTLTDGSIHRASIAVKPDATGKLDITNSELAYLGYASSPRQGLYYSGGGGSVIKNNTIHNLWYGFYSKGTGNLTVENNTVRDGLKYGIDPHTGTHDMIIRNNHVYNNGHIGIICSIDCKNIVIEGNRVANNTNAGIMLSKNVKDSTVKGNDVSKEETGISLSESSSNKVFDNKVSDVVYGIQVKAGSSMNLLQNNSIANSTKYAILLIKDPRANTVSHNKISEPNGYGICLSGNSIQNVVSLNSITNSGRHGICINNQGSQNEIRLNFIDGANGYGIYVTNSTRGNNTFTGNEVRNAKIGITVSNNTDSIFLQNQIGDVKQTEYAISDNSTLNLHQTVFSSDKVKSSGGENLVLVSNSGTLEVTNKAGLNNKTNIDTNNGNYSVQLPDKGMLTLTTIK